MLRGILLTACLFGASISGVSPARAQDALGVVWTEVEGGGFWHGTWTRQGSTNRFSAEWNGGRVTADLVISMVGNSVTVVRKDIIGGNACDYRGTVSGAEVKGTYTCLNGGPFEWSATIQQGFTGGKPQVIEAGAQVLCDDRQAALDELVLRAKAAQTSLEMTRTLRAAYDEAYNANREYFTTSATLTVAMLAAGWPIGKALQDKVLGEAKNTFAEKLLKAGLKAVDKRILNSATAEGTTGLDDRKNLEAEIFSGLVKEGVKSWADEAGKAQSDEARERLGSLLGKESAESVFIFYDLFKLQKSVLTGMSVLEGYRYKLREIELTLRLQEQIFDRRLAMAETARRAVEQCLFALSQGGAPDDEEFNWRDVQAYLAK